MVYKKYKYHLYLREAWFDRKGLTSQGAKREYIRLVENFAPNFRESGDNAKEEGEDAIFLTDEEYNIRRKEVSNKN